MDRRRFLRTALGAAGAPLLLSALGCNNDKNGSSGGASTAAAAGGSGSGAADGLIRIGFIPLTDCASVVMADKLGLFKKHGVNVEVTKEASWANVRDKLLTGELSAAHCLFSMPLSVYTGIGGPAGKELKIAMVLNANGQAITLRRDMAAQAGYAELDGVKPAVETLRATKMPTFAMTFPGGTHDIWLRYWLAAAKIDQDSVKIVTIPPPQMVANMKVGNMDGYCVGEPWNGVAVKQDIGYTHVATQDIWKDHPEKALVANADFAETRKDDLRKVMMAVLEASLWLDDLKNRAEAAKVIGGTAYVNAPPDVIDARLAGRYALGGGLGDKVFHDDYMLYHKGGQVNFPRKEYAVWFLAQYQRFGYLKEAPDYDAIADRLILDDLYREAAGALKIAVPDDGPKPFTAKLDGIEFDPKDPAGSLGRYARIA
jgi:nitrate/nitrite transport system substrate-binding protein